MELKEIEKLKNEVEIQRTKFNYENRKEEDQITIMFTLTALLTISGWMIVYKPIEPLLLLLFLCILWSIGGIFLYLVPIKRRRGQIRDENIGLYNLVLKELIYELGREEKEGFVSIERVFEHSRMKKKLFDESIDSLEKHGIIERKGKLRIRPYK